MGNESSKLKGLEIDKNAVEANDYWALFDSVAATTANEEGKQYLSIFQGEPVVSGQLWVIQSPMERAIKNLMIYRHPYILKYVCTWEHGGQKHLATEKVRPLQSILNQQTDIQVCLGLRTILCSLIFLVEKAMARHLNICIQSIYVTDCGSWRLAGFEYVWKKIEVTKTLLDFANAHRYQLGIDPDEPKEANIETIEQYAFASLCEEVLLKCSNNNKQSPIPHVKDFLEYCATHLKHKNPLLRPKLSAILLHPYFNHEFVLIHSFLFELPLKDNQEKQEFFTGLVDRLRYFDEEVVGSQFAGDLLSRMVLLDTTAQLCVTPYVLKTKTDLSSALFSSIVYKKFLMPQILKLFRLRDAQMRLILLEYFMEFVKLLRKEEIEELILPHLLAGMQDTNDVLVAKTLRCMADLIPILGASNVVGGQRIRLFSDGRPQAAISDTNTHWVEPRSITPVLGETSDCPMVSGSPILENFLSKTNSDSSLSQVVSSEIFEHNMPPRLSPDGGEDIKCKVLQDLMKEDEEISYDTTNQSTVSNGTSKLDNENCNILDLDKNIDADDESWSDWENNDKQSVENNKFLCNNDITATTTGLTISKETSLKKTNAETSFGNTRPLEISVTESNHTAKSINSSSHSSLKPGALSLHDDLSCLDIQVQAITTEENKEITQFNFFKDMEPVIDTNGKHKHNMPINSTYWPYNDSLEVNTSRFATDSVNDDANNGWQVDDDDELTNELIKSSSESCTSKA